LNSQLANIPLQAGCNKIITKFLKNIVRDIKDEKEKYVAFLWDEVSLQPALLYNKAHDKIIGFEDWDIRRTRKITNHAIVFYLKSLKTEQKMPLDYGCCESATKTFQLVRCIKEWLSNIMNMDLSR